MVIAPLFLSLAVKWNRYHNIGLQTIIDICLGHQSTQWLCQPCVPIIFQSMNTPAQRFLIGAHRTQPAHAEWMVLAILTCPVWRKWSPAILAERQRQGSNLSNTGWT